MARPQDPVQPRIRTAVSGRPHPPANPDSGNRALAAEPPSSSSAAAYRKLRSARAGQVLIRGNWSRWRWTRSGRCLASAREVRQVILGDREIACITVMTTMDNLYHKGWLLRHRHSRAYLYRPRRRASDCGRCRPGGGRSRHGGCRARCLRCRRLRYVHRSLPTAGPLRRGQQRTSPPRRRSRSRPPTATPVMSSVRSAS
ncbi:MULTISPECIES: BlaI/MecI/CopY family transcriptional regulator [Nocardia]|uniref:BlaI/MecI/CopY family transcriptional regulator n=1 Tax=Nocardia TaxID=1817 RepID=UPI0009EB8B59|nr:MULTISPECIES: BlaI/MecI/CopY family transcriptional regulator [Nocardia]